MASQTNPHSLQCESATDAFASANDKSSPMKDSDSPSEEDNMDAIDRSLVSNVMADGAIRNYDRPDSSPSSPSQFNSSFEDPDHQLHHNHQSSQSRPGLLSGSDPFGSSGMNLDGSFERRSRRKPTSEDIVRRVKPPIDAPPYDSEESEIEDDIMNDEIMMKLNRVTENDEVDGIAKPALRMMEGFGGDDERFKEEMRQYSINRLSRLEAVDGIPEDDDEEDMEMRSEEDFLDAEKRAFYKDLPVSIYNLMHEVKVNAHAMFMKTASCLPPLEAKVRRDEYLLQLLSNLRDRCLEDGLKPEVVGAILKDVESEISSISEDYEEMKMKQYMEDIDMKENAHHHGDFNGMPADSNVHFLSRPDDDMEQAMYGSKPEDAERDKRLPSSHPQTFLNATTPPASSTISSSLSPSTSTSTTSPSSQDVKPIITTISTNGIVRTHIKEEGVDKGPPPPLINHPGGIHGLASSISEAAFSPNMFPGNGKMGPWFPGGLLPNMPMLPFSPSGSPLDHAFGRKFLPFEGKMGENVDKDYLKCQFCERTFRRQKNLENHIESTHQGKNPLKGRRETTDMYFKCSHCPYTTKHQSNLYVHLRIHTGKNTCRLKRNMSCVRI